MNLGEAILNRRPPRISRPKPPKAPRVYRAPPPYVHATPAIDRAVMIVGERGTAGDVADEMKISLNAAHVYLLRALVKGRVSKWKEGKYTYWKEVK